jgi:glutamine synthetase
LPALKTLTALLTKAQEKLTELGKATKAAEDTHDEYKKAELYATGVTHSMLELRTIVDEMEAIVADDAWPLPKYREMLFIS